MLAAVRSAVLEGVDGRIVTVEVHVSRGLPGYTVVGLPDAAGRESRERVRAEIGRADALARQLIAERAAADEQARRTVIRARQVQSATSVVSALPSVLDAVARSVTEARVALARLVELNPSEKGVDTPYRPLVSVLRELGDTAAESVRKAPTSAARCTCMSPMPTRSSPGPAPPARRCPPRRPGCWSWRCCWPWRRRWQACWCRRPWLPAWRRSQRPARRRPRSCHRARYCRRGDRRTVRRGFVGDVCG